MAKHGDIKLNRESLFIFMDDKRAELLELIWKAAKKEKQWAITWLADQIYGKAVTQGNLNLDTSEDFLKTLTKLDELISSSKGDDKDPVPES